MSWILLSSCTTGWRGFVGITAPVDFIFVWYSEIDSGLSSTNRFHFQGNIVKVSCVWESMCNVFTQTFLSFFTWAIQFPQKSSKQGAFSAALMKRSVCWYRMPNAAFEKCQVDKCSEPPVRYALVRCCRKNVGWTVDIAKKPTFPHAETNVGLPHLIDCTTTTRRTECYIHVF